MTHVTSSMVMLVSATFVATTICVTEADGCCLGLCRQQILHGKHGGHVMSEVGRATTSQVTGGLTACSLPDGHLADACWRALEHACLLERREAAMEG